MGDFVVLFIIIKKKNLVILVGIEYTNCTYTLFTMYILFTYSYREKEVLYFSNNKDTNYFP